MSPYPMPNPSPSPNPNPNPNPNQRAAEELAAAELAAAENRGQAKAAKKAAGEAGAALAAAKEKQAKLLNSPALRAPLSSGWEEVPDPTGGPTYYYHAATGQTQWDRPEEEVSSRSSAGEKLTLTLTLTLTGRATEVVGQVPAVQPGQQVAHLPQRPGALRRLRHEQRLRQRASGGHRVHERLHRRQPFAAGCAAAAAIEQGPPGQGPRLVRLRRLLRPRRPGGACHLGRLRLRKRHLEPPRSRAQAELGPAEARAGRRPAAGGGDELQHSHPRAQPGADAGAAHP